MRSCSQGDDELGESRKQSSCRNDRGGALEAKEIKEKCQKEDGSVPCQIVRKIKSLVTFLFYPR